MSIVTSTRARIQTLDNLAERFLNNEHGRRFTAVGNGVKSSLVALHNVVENPNPTDNANAVTLRVAHNAKLLDAKAKAANDSNYSILQEFASDISKRINEKVPLVPDEHAAEIRAVIRGMNPVEVNAALAKLATDNSAHELAAVTEVHPVLSGVSKEQQDRFRNMAVDMHAKDEVSEMAALMQSFDIASEIYKVAKATAADYSNDHNVAQIMKQQQRAKDADSAMKESLSH